MRRDEARVGDVDPAEEVVATDAALDRLGVLDRDVDVGLCRREDFQDRGKVDDALRRRRGSG